jgi:negative regulator of replication initiation
LKRSGQTGELFQSDCPKSEPDHPQQNTRYQEKRKIMKRFQSILCASLLAVAMASSAFAGNITTLKDGNITTLKDGNITTLKDGNITTLKDGIILTDYFYIALAGLLG